MSCLSEEGKDQSSLAELNGMWRLIYSSAFARGATPSLPGYKLGQVKHNDTCEIALHMFLTVRGGVLNYVSIFLQTHENLLDPCKNCRRPHRGTVRLILKEEHTQFRIKSD